MSLDDLKANISESKKIVLNIQNLRQQLKYSNPKVRSLIMANINSSFNRLALINRAIPDILKSISAVKKLTSAPIKEAPEKKVVNFKYTSVNSGSASVIALKKEDKTKFLKELSLSESSLKKLNNTKGSTQDITPNLLAIVSTKIFGGLTNKYVDSFSDLKKDLQESNSRFLLPTYLSIALFISFSLFFLSIILMVVLAISGVSVLSYFWVPLLLLLVLPTGFYLMPTLSKSAVDKEITNELPFAVIYMSAIAGSNIEPTKIFKVISQSSEYKNIGIEMKKIISQVEVYGYDLVTALKNVAKVTINLRFSELLNGMATNISSGSSLKNYLDKKAENLLMDYKLERNRYNEVAATFMDVYISVLITAPLILVMLVVIMDLTSLKLGNLSTESLLIISISLVALVNVFFLIFLQIKQPKV
jgi:hypothetical protein